MAEHTTVVGVFEGRTQKASEVLQHHGASDVQTH